MLLLGSVAMAGAAASEDALFGPKPVIERSQQFYGPRRQGGAT